MILFTTVLLLCTILPQSSNGFCQLYPRCKAFLFQHYYPNPIYKNHKNQKQNKAEHSNPYNNGHIGFFDHLILETSKRKNLEPENLRSSDKKVLCENVCGKSEYLRRHSGNFSVNGAENGEGERIIGGSVADPGGIPWMVRIFGGCAGKTRFLDR